MEFDFFNEWNRTSTIKVGRHLMGKIVKLSSFQELSSNLDNFPEGTIDAGNQLERYSLSFSQKLLLTRDIGKILVDEAEKLHLNKNLKEIKIGSSDDLSVLSQLISIIWNKDTTHFTFG